MYVCESEYVNYAYIYIYTGSFLYMCTELTKKKYIYIYYIMHYYSSV